MSIQPAWLMRTDLYSCLVHLQNGCEAMADSLLVFMPHKRTHRASSIPKQIGLLSPDGTKARAVKNVMKLIAYSLSFAKLCKAYKVAPSTQPTGLMGRNGLFMSESHQSYQGAATSRKQRPSDTGAT